MKSNLKEQVEALQTENQELTKRLTTLQNRFDNYLVPRFQQMDTQIVECQTANKFLTGMQNAIMKLEDWRSSLADSPIQCDHCIWVKVVVNEDHHNIGICNNPKSNEYQEEVDAGGCCNHFETKPEIVVEPEDDSK